MWRRRIVGGFEFMEKGGRKGEVDLDRFVWWKLTAVG